MFLHSRRIATKAPKFELCLASSVASAEQILRKNKQTERKLRASAVDASLEKDWANLRETSEGLGKGLSQPSVCTRERGERIERERERED